MAADRGKRTEMSAGASMASAWSSAYHPRRGIGCPSITDLGEPIPFTKQASRNLRRVTTLVAELPSGIVRIKGHNGNMRRRGPKPMRGLPEVTSPPSKKRGRMGSEDVPSQHRVACLKRREAGPAASNSACSEDGPVQRRVVVLEAKMNRVSVE